VDTVEVFDKRILDLDTNEIEVTTKDQQRLVVDAYSRYRITDPLKFYQNVRSQQRVLAVLGPVVESTIRNVLNTVALPEVVKDKREGLMKEIARIVNSEGKDYGIEVVDVRLKRANLHPTIAESVFNRMIADRQRVATELRAQGQAENNRITSNADRDVTVLKGEATKSADILRGEGEGERNRIFAEAYGRDPEFARFYRALQACEQSFQSKDTRFLLSPDTSSVCSSFTDAVKFPMPK
ncbi:MAG: protease modulator HflC, partial [Hyphomicrobiaceae bacterium]|nr:protease modulator HflC [Hyphomicrobiaceae bacterium]